MNRSFPATLIALFAIVALIVITALPADASQGRRHHGGGDDVNVTTNNNANVGNIVLVGADTGDNDANGGDGGNGNNGGDGGNGKNRRSHRGHHGHHGGGSTGDGGNGGDGGAGGDILIGDATARAKVANVVNRNMTRVRR